MNGFSAPARGLLVAGALIMGKGLGISTLAVLIALLFRGWFFGTAGMFLAVPLTAALIIALDASPHTRPIAIMLGPAIKPEPPPELGPER